MANKYWVATTASNWNNTANWSTLSGGAGGAGVPSGSDAVIFDGNGLGDCEIDYNAPMASLDVRSGYSGKIDNYIHGKSLSITGDATFAGSGEVDFGRDLGGGRPVWTIGGNFDYSGQSTFTGSRARFKFTGTGKTIKGSSQNIGDLYFDGATVEFLTTVFGGSGNTIHLDNGSTLTINGTKRYYAGTTTITLTGTGSNNIVGTGTLHTANVNFTTNHGIISVDTIEIIGDYTGVARSFDGHVYFAPAIYGDAVLTFPAGTTYFNQDVTFDTTNYALTINNNVNNPVLNFNRNVYTNVVNAFTWNKGTGKNSFTGGDSDIYFGDKEIDAVEFKHNTGYTKTLTGNFKTASITITSGTFDISTYNCISAGATDVDGVLKIGVSSDTGLTTNGISLNAADTAIFQTLSKINNSGDMYGASQAFTYETRAIYTQTGNGNASWAYPNYFYKYYLNEGVTINMTGSCYFSAPGNPHTEINGIIDTNSEVLTIGGSGAFTIGANAEFQGNGRIQFIFYDSITYTNNKIGTHSFAGDIYIYPWSSHLLIIGGDFRYADYYIIKLFSGTWKRTFTPGDLRCNNFIIQTAAGNTKDIYASTNNPDIYIYGNMDLNDGDGTYTWYKGTGTINLVGGDANIDTAGQTIDNVYVEATGTKTLTDNVVVNSLTTVTGILDMNGKTVTTVSNATLHPGCSITGINGATLSVGGNFFSAGIEANHIELKGTAAWYLTVTGTADADYTDAAYSDASGGTAVTATGVDFGNNTSWNYVAMRQGLSASQGHYVIALYSMDEGQ